MEAAVRRGREEPALSSPQSSPRPRTPETCQTPHVEAAQAIQRLIYVRDEVAPAREKLIAARRTNEALGEVSRRRPRPTSASEVRRLPHASMGSFAPPAMPGAVEDNFRSREIYGSPSSSGGRMGPGHMRVMPTLGAKRLAKELSIGSTPSRRNMQEQLKEPEKTQEQRVEFVKALRIRVAQEKLAETQRREEQALRWRRHQDSLERETAGEERGYNQTWLLDGDIKSKFSYAAHRELMAHDNGAGQIEEYVEEMPLPTEPVKRLGDVVKVEEIPRPGSAASTAFDSRPGSAARPGSAMSWETGRPQSARRPYPPLSRPSSAVVQRPVRPVSARPQTSLPAVSPSVASDDTGTKSSQEPRHQRVDESAGDPALNDLETEVAKINAGQPLSSPSFSRDGRPRRTSLATDRSAASDHYDYEGRDIAAPSPALSEGGANERDSRPSGRDAQDTYEMEEEREAEQESQGPKLGEFSIISIRRLFDELDTERKGFVTRRELLFALNSREDLYRQFCHFYLQTAQDSPEGLDCLSPEVASPEFVDDWLSAHRAAHIERTDWEEQAHSYIFEEPPSKKVRGRKSLIFRRSLEFLDEAYKQVCLLRAPTQVGSRLYQKCYNITLEILVHYFRMQGLLLEYQTAPILNLLPADRTAWVDQIPPVFEALQATGAAALGAEGLGDPRPSCEDTQKARVFIMAKGAVVDGEDPDLDKVKEGSLVRVEKVLEVPPDQLNALLGNQQVSLFLASPSASQREDEGETEAEFSPTSPPLAEEEEAASEQAVAEEDGSEVLAAAAKVPDAAAPDEVPQEVALTLPTLAESTEPVPPKSEGPAKSEATSEAKKSEKPYEHCSGIVTPSSRAEADLTPARRMKPKSQVQYHTLRHDGTDGQRQEFEPLVQTSEDTVRKLGITTLRVAVESLGETMPFSYGAYILIRPTFVTPSADIENPTEDDGFPEMSAGAEVAVLEIVEVADLNLVCGRIEEPSGWIQLMDVANGLCHAVAKDFETKMDVAAEEGAFDVGLYVLRQTAFVAPDAENFDPNDEELVDELDEGFIVRIDEVVNFPDAERVRAHLQEPSGWITLVNTATGSRWATKVQDELPAEPDVVQGDEQAQESPDEEAEHGEQADGEAAEPERTPFPAGIYILLRPAFVSPAADIFAPDDDELVAELDEGEEIEVVEVVDFTEEERLRARLADPEGWITLMSRATGTVWASLKEDVMHDEASDARSGGDNSAVSGDEERAEEETPADEEAGSQEEVPADEEATSDEGDSEHSRPRGSEQLGRVRIDGFDETMPFSYGTYILIRPTFVTPKPDIDNPTKEEGFKELPEGEEVAVLEVVEVADLNIVCGRIQQPKGWIQLLDTAAGICNAIAKDFEIKMQDAVEQGTFDVGLHILRRNAFVSPDADNFDPDDEELVDELEEGLIIRIDEIEEFSEAERLRAHVEDPDGWITLVNTATGTRWATKVPEEAAVHLDHLEGGSDREILSEDEAPDRTAVDPEEEEGEDDSQELPHEEAEPGEQEPEGPSFPAGIYVLLRPTFVSPAADIFAPDDDELIAELEEGEEIEIVEVEDFPEEERVRGRILDPDGWVTLMNTATGTVWASLKEEAADSGGEEEGAEEEAAPDEEEEAEEAMEEEEPTPEDEDGESEHSASGTESKPFDLGIYVLSRSAFVAPRAEVFEPDDDELVAVLDEGKEIEVVKVVDFRKDGRVRGKLKSPQGWITMMNSVTKVKWVATKDEIASGLKTSDLGQDPPPYDNGHYLLLRSAYVAYDADNFAPDDADVIAKLKEGDEVEVVEVIDFFEDDRVRGRLFDPDGWITLLNRATGDEWITPKAPEEEEAQGSPAEENHPEEEAQDGPLDPDDEAGDEEREASDEEAENGEHADVKAALPEGSPFPAGIYVLLRPAFVAPAADIFAPDDDELLAELEEGEEVEVVEVMDFPQEMRMRGKLKRPDGWITLKNSLTGTVWISRKEEKIEEDADPAGSADKERRAEEEVFSDEEEGSKEADLTDEEGAEEDALSQQESGQEEGGSQHSAPGTPQPPKTRKPFDVGLYVLRRPAFVAPRAEVFEPDDDELVAELEEGEEIELVEVIDFRKEGRVRGKLKFPEGWITLRNSATGIKWVAPKDESAGGRKTSKTSELEQDPPPYERGFYLLLRSAYVAYDADNFAPDDDEIMAELEEGDEVEVVEVVDFAEEERVRGRLYDPAGWITLLNRATGAEWVTPKVSPTEAEGRGDSEEEYDSQDEDEESPRRRRMNYDVGEYILLRPAFVARDAKNFDPDDDEVVEELEEGQEVRAVEIVELKEEKRVRARLHQPDGWVTFANTATGVRRVMPKEEWLETRTAESYVSGDETESVPESEDSQESEPDDRDVKQAPRDKRPSERMSFADVGIVHTDGDLLGRANQGELAPTPKFKQLYSESKREDGEADQQTDDEVGFTDDELE